MGRLKKLELLTYTGKILGQRSFAWFLEWQYPQEFIRSSWSCQEYNSKFTFAWKIESTRAIFVATIQLNKQPSPMSWDPHLISKIYIQDSKKSTIEAISRSLSLSDVPQQLLTPVVSRYHAMALT